MRSKLSIIDRIISEKFASLNNLLAATKMPPRTYTTVEKRKYAPIGKDEENGADNGNMADSHVKRIQENDHS